MIPFTLRITLSIVVICYFVIILYYLKKRMLELKYTLIWLAVGVVMGVMVLFPAALVGESHWKYLFWNLSQTSIMIKEYVSSRGC